jgi:hypothetical protein
MRLIKIEVDKILHRKFSRWLLIVTTIVLPLALIIISDMSTQDEALTEAEFIANLSFAIISYIQSYIFLPIWIILFIGQELSNGYINRFVFARSRKDYFLSKLLYCVSIASYFSVLGIISFIASAYTASVLSDITIFQCMKLFCQLALSTLSYAMLLMSLVFIVRSPAIGFIIYLAWNFSEGILFRVAAGIWSIELKWLPLHLVRTLYTINGEATSGNYHNPFDGNPTAITLPITFIMIATMLTYQSFLQTDLKPLSD